MSDLSLIQTDELINEVCKRFDHIAITAIRVTNGKGEFIQLRRHEGHRHINISQLEIMKKMLIDQEINSALPLQGNLDR